MSWSLSQAHVQEKLQEQLQEYDVAQYGAFVISELTQWSGALTRLVSDLGQAHQKYICIRYLSRRLTSLAPTNEESAWLNEKKNHIVKKIVSCMSACDVTCVVILVTNNPKRKSL